MNYTYTGTAPNVVDDITPDDPTNTAPGVNAPAALSNAAPATLGQAGLSGAAPADNAVAALTSTPPISFDMMDGTFTAEALPDMPSTFVPAFNGLTGAGNTLASLNANAGNIGQFVQGKDGERMRTYEVCAGADATAAPGVIRCANFDAVANAIVFVER